MTTHPLKLFKDKHYVVTDDQELMMIIENDDTKHERECTAPIDLNVPKTRMWTYPKAVPQNAVQELLSLVTYVETVNEANYMTTASIH